MAKISKTDWAYAAAMVDGEGHFSISKHRQEYEPGRFYWMFDARVGVSNTSTALMKWLRDRFGGEYHDGRQGANRPCYRWNLDGYKKMEEFTLAILPYLVIKREQAHLFLEFMRMRNQKNPARRMEICLRVQALNKGEASTTNTSDEGAQDFDFFAPSKIESELHGDMQSAPLVTATA